MIIYFSEDLVIVDISLDNPDFSDRVIGPAQFGDCADWQIALDVIAVKVHDAPKSSSSSSALSGHPQRSCSSCLDRMSSFDRDSH